MDWSPKNWRAPHVVKTPKIVPDIAKYIDKDVTQEKYNGLDANTQRRLDVLAERLEFIDHLSTLSELLVRHQSASADHPPLAGEETKVVTEYSAIIGGHDFAGFNFDADALIVYLLLTCVDTVKGKAKYMDVFDWLKGRQPEEYRADWDKLSDEYKQAYGLSQRFRRAFTEDCSQGIRKEIAEDFAVVKIASQKVTAPSIEAWEKRSQARRVDRVARELYDIRSGFTHASIRSFSPRVPVACSLDTREAVLLQRVGSPPLRTVLTDVVKHLAVKLLIRKND
mgnify:CR=1 FL=1